MNSNLPLLHFFSISSPRTFTFPALTNTTQNWERYMNKSSPKSWSPKHMDAHNDLRCNTRDHPQSSGSSSGNNSSNNNNNLLFLGIGGTLFLFPHLAILLSLPPVLLRWGAPYLPTFESKLNTMFNLIHRHIQHLQSMQQKLQTRYHPHPPTSSSSSLRFVDLGSGDGRVVFRASREGVVALSVGYEINPVLHLVANF